jgi:hypothetical protein
LVALQPEIEKPSNSQAGNHLPEHLQIKGIFAAPCMNSILTP